MKKKLTNANSNKPTDKFYDKEKLKTKKKVAWEGSKADKAMDKRQGAKEGSKKDNAIDAKMQFKMKKGKKMKKTGKQLLAKAMKC